MLKRTVLVIFALAVAMQASAKGGIVKTEWGVTAGIRYNGMNAFSASNLSVKPDMTYNVGIHASLAFAGVAIQPELNYGYTEVKVSYPSGGEMGSSVVTAHNLEVPLLLSLRMLPIVRFNLGPVFNIMSKTSYKNGNAKMMFGDIHPTFGYAVGVSVCVLKKLLIDARFVGYFEAPVNEFNYGNVNDPNDTTTFKTKLYSGGIKIGYLF